MTETTSIGSSKIETAASGGVAIWAPEGRLDAVSAPDLQRAMMAAIDGGASDVVLDLSGTRYMSSAGLRVVLVVARALQDGNGRFAVCGLNDEVKELFEVSGFSRIVNIVADRGAAVAAVRPAD